MPKKSRREKKKAKRKRRSGGAGERPPNREPVDERRGVVVEATAMGGVPFDEPHIITVIEPIRLASGDDLYFQSPFVAPFYLLKAKELRDRAEPRRVRVLANTTRTDDGTLRPNHPSTAFDVLEDLALAVILAVAAIEAHANDMIGRLPEDAMVEIPTRVAGTTVPLMRNKAGMDWLPLSDKLSRACPLLHGSESIKGTVAWQKYKGLSRIRNKLLHQRREAVNDPLKPSAFGRLLLGEGSSAPEDAAKVIEALELDWLPDQVRAELGLPAKTTS
ncbi:MAG: hypothetical protein WD689_02405 [Gaiellaceae bacterium]